LNRIVEQLGIRLKVNSAHCMEPGMVSNGI